MAVGIGQDKVELALLQVGTSHLDTHGITKLIFVVVPASSQAEVALVEVIVVIIEIAHGHHSFAVVLVDLGIDAIGCDAADVGVKLLSDLVTHELHHLILDGIALGILGYDLHVAAVLTEFLVVLLVGRAPARLVFGE